MSTLHLPQPRYAADVKRAELLAQRVVEGMRTLDDIGRRDVIRAITASFCVQCGRADPTCRCVL